MIRVVDYGVGNVQAFLNLFKRLGIGADRASIPEDFEDATHLILPGVGHFDHAMRQLKSSGLLLRLEYLVKEERIPIMGICVGMQMLATSSDEGSLPGLNWIPGRVRAFADNSKCNGLIFPHMGWNDLQTCEGEVLFTKGFDFPLQFYFLHSYYFEADDMADVLATTRYGIDFDAVVRRNNIYGIQCHPEKSHRWGMCLLKNFAEL